MYAYQAKNPKTNQKAKSNKTLFRSNANEWNALNRPRMCVDMWNKIWMASDDEEKSERKKSETETNSLLSTISVIHKLFDCWFRENWAIASEMAATKIEQANNRKLIVCAYILKRIGRKIFIKRYLAGLCYSSIYLCVCVWLHSNWYWPCMKMEINNNKTASPRCSMRTRIIKSPKANIFVLSSFLPLFGCTKVLITHSTSYSQ